MFPFKHKFLCSQPDKKCSWGKPAGYIFSSLKYVFMNARQLKHLFRSSTKCKPEKNRISTHKYLIWAQNGKITQDYLKSKSHYLVQINTLSITV